MDEKENKNIEKNILNEESSRKEKTNVPNLRFDFIGNWYSKTLKETASFLKGKGLSKDQLCTKGNKCILYGELYTYYNEHTIIENIKSKTQSNIDKPIYSKENDIIIPASGETPIDISTACCVKQNNVILGGDLNIIRLKNHNGSFVSYILRGKKKKEIARIAQGASIVHLHNDDLKNISIGFPPSISEECRISMFFNILDTRIETQNKIIEKLKSLIISIRENIISSNRNWNWIKLDSLIKQNIVILNRGSIIPKHDYDNEYKYPVYSSSVHNLGLMGYNNSYMFDSELITWSIDGGGDLFFREKHKFNVTNVCGILKVNECIYNYRFVAEILKSQHSKIVFDYQTKAHPSVIRKLYSLPQISMEEQNKYAKLFKMLYKKLNVEEKLLEKYKEQKKYLLSNMFI